MVVHVAIKLADGRRVSGASLKIFQYGAFESDVRCPRNLSWHFQFRANISNHSWRA
jgi:hypothetical protein